MVGALTLGSNSLLDVGTAAAPAIVSIGSNSDTGSNVSGELNALESAATVNLQLSDLVVGSSVGGAATGTLRWNQSEAVRANRVFFGNGRGSTGILDVPAGGSFLLGTAAERIGELNIAYDASGSSVTGTTTSADLDFTVTNPTFEAYIDSGLSIGRKTRAEGSNTVVGALTLGSNSLLDVGTAAAPATVSIGSNSDTGSNVSGELDTRSGISNIQASTVNVGTSSGGTATGTLSMGANDLVTATTVNIGTNASRHSESGGRTVGRSDHQREWAGQHLQLHRRSPWFGWRDACGGYV